RVPPGVPEPQGPGGVLLRGPPDLPGGAARRARLLGPAPGHGPARPVPVGRAGPAGPRPIRPARGAGPARSRLGGAGGLRPRAPVRAPRTDPPDDPRVPGGVRVSAQAEQERKKPAPSPSGHDDDVIEPQKKALIRGAGVDLAARDPEFIRRQLPLMWLLSTLYFRAEVRGMERVPEDGPVLFVGNHSGGNMSPDSMVFMLAFNTYFGMERPIFALAHSLVTTFPVVGRIGKKWGIVTAGPQAGEAILAAGADVLVYPGGDLETHRSWRRHEQI